MTSVVVPDLHGCPHFLDWVRLKYPGRHLILLGDGESVRASPAETRTPA
ncbi:hypothetical protein ACFOPQ_12630 [Deinococcus antarcticus]|uniref:Calcineurin-like phosphoesterase domain-containing protein n=1 Tax=Deinococcus antarcticus TaxID=1298767 RepID=A0ABV8A8X3_9DEIO